jgi:hypothetical protein
VENSAVVTKKRWHQTRNLGFNNPQASFIRYEALWYATFIAIYVWFLYWVAYDIFVWHKPLVQVNVMNYAGSIASIAFIWAGSKIWKSGPINTRKQQMEKPQPIASSKSECTHYLGYLHKRQKSEKIPAECLTCKKVVQCFYSKK